MSTPNSADRHARIEAALEDLFIMRVAYVFDGDCDEVRMPIEDLMNLLLETDFT